MHAFAWHPRPQAAHRQLDECALFAATSIIIATISQSGGREALSSSASMGEIFRNPTLSNFDAFLPHSPIISRNEVRPAESNSVSAVCDAAEGGVELALRDRRAAFRHP